ncbi:hypothetical protein VP01_878g4 [Puccinia sorghi]|uniref:Uncharacterized protein n=1 Tax=Puccinia sorghi TaxID=27349 RepID=A0A0L6U8F7_9BASI|nr:hypothetical protein VP01_878g4 [Puccinia sorghi]
MAEINEVKMQFQAMFEKMKNDFNAKILWQNDEINSLNAKLLASHNAHSIPLANSFDDYLLKQFIKTLLSFDRSNYSEWETAVDWTIQHAFPTTSFLKIPLFLKSLDNARNKAVTSLLRNTLDTALLTIVESDEITSADNLFTLLRNKCKRSGQHHKIILINQLLKFATERSSASKAWLARFCAVWSDIERAKISRNKLGGLIMQALASAPLGVKAKTFKYSISQPLDNMTSVPTFGEVTTISQSALSKASNSKLFGLHPVVATPPRRSVTKTISPTV